MTVQVCPYFLNSSVDLSIPGRSGAVPFLMQAGLLDTAACDGPVQFHRVVNKYFTVDCENKTRGLEAAEQKDTGDTGDTADTGETGDTYCCVYCNLIFKSHYCYQKHKRYICSFCSKVVQF